MLPIDQLIAAAVLAPSADNNQPWRFIAEEHALRFCLDSRRALPSDVDGMFDLIALGAALENATIAAAQLGFASSTSYLGTAVTGLSATDPFPEVARIDLEAGGVADPLFAQLNLRCTNRRPFSRRPLSTQHAKTLTSSVMRFHLGGVRLHLIHERRCIRQLAALVAQADCIRFEHRPFHAELFRQLRFSRHEATRTRDGLDVRTLALPPGAAALLRGLKPWPMMQLLTRARLSWLLGLPSAITTWRSGAIGLLTVPERSTEAFVEGGRAFQRLWLTAQSIGLSVHPLGSLPIFLAMLESPDTALPLAKRQQFQRLRDSFTRIAPDARQPLLMAFRIGYARAPRHRSLRRDVREFPLDRPLAQPENLQELVSHG